MANLIPVIAKELDLSIDEIFKIKGYVDNYRFTNTELQINITERVTDTAWESAPLTILNILVCNSDLVIKQPFEPKEGYEYWTYWDLLFVPHKTEWNNYTLDYIRKATGCVFRTKEEAIKARPEVYKRLTGKEWENGQEKSDRKS